VWVEVWSGEALSVCVVGPDETTDPEPKHYNRG